ncbi:LytR/AlgR family response regulator transcription factor [Colwelliaceae bacterium BS250]
MINAVIVEDSELARLELKNLLLAHPEITIIGEAEDVDSAVALITKKSPDLIFMDIDLPGGNAFDILSRLTIIPALIFTTAFDNFALDAFEFNTVDYLLKPIKKQRLEKALNKLSANEHSEQAIDLLSGESQFFIKDGDKCWLIKVNEVRYIEAIGNYSRIHFAQQSPMHYSSIQKIEQRLDPKIFFRINRQELVNLNYVKSIEPWVTGGLRLTLTCGTELDVSRRQANNLKNLMML